VTSIAGTVAGTSNPNFLYDGNGNMQCMTTHASCSGSAARSMSWTASNMLSSLSDSTTGNSFALAYDTNRARITTGLPCAISTSTCRSFATISSAVCLFLAILQGGPFQRGQITSRCGYKQYILYLLFGIEEVFGTPHLERSNAPDNAC
jgi:hypothetical protein